VWLDEGYPFVELFSGDTLPDATRHRRSLGVEPMSAAPNAFQTGDGLRVLQPEESWTTNWGMQPAERSP
jgi:aldose 1-epimerase